MTKQEIIDYIMTTPNNPNKAVLEGMLDSIANAGGGDDPTVGTFTIVGDKMADPTTGSDVLHSFETIKIPSNVKTMASGAFVQSYLKSVIWESAEVVPAGAFSQCNQLEYVYLGDGVTNIDAYAFHGSTAPFIIDCGFAESAVAGAPWGAENATINYNVPAPRDI